MNISQGGASEYSHKSGGRQPEPDQRISNSAGGIEDLTTWLKFESSKIYEQSLMKLGLDSSKI